MLRLELFHFISEVAVIALGNKLSSSVPPVIVDPLGCPVEVGLNLVVEVRIHSRDAQEELKSASEIDLGAASAAPLAKVGRSELPRYVEQHGLAQPAARVRRVWSKAAGFATPDLDAFINAGRG